MGYNSENRKIRIFFSSTFRYLNDERNYLNDIIFPDLIRKSRERGVTLTFVDLRWGITDEKSILEIMHICLQEIDKATPHFIGILAGRYGYVIDDEHIPRGDEYEKINQKYWELLKRFLEKDRLSLTHIGMERGVLSNSDPAEYAYFYFKSEESMAVRETNAEFQKHLNGLKNKIRTPNGIGMKIIAPLKSLAIKSKWTTWRC
jgi:hypothetical protein